MKTIKELEKSIGVSKVSLYSMVKREEFKNHVFKGENNTKLIDEVGEQLLKAYYLKEQSESIADIITESIEHEETSLNDSKADSKATNKDNKEVKNVDIIGILQEQLKEKDNQINALLNIVTNQQKLQATQLITDNNKIIPSNEGDPDELRPPKKSFLDKIFKRYVIDKACLFYFWKNPCNFNHLQYN